MPTNNSVIINFAQPGLPIHLPSLPMYNKIVPFHNKMHFLYLTYFFLRYLAEITLYAANFAFVDPWVSAIYFFHNISTPQITSHQICRQTKFVYWADEVGVITAILMPNKSRGPVWKKKKTKRKKQNGGLEWRLQNDLKIDKWLGSIGSWMRSVLPVWGQIQCLFCLYIIDYWFGQLELQLAGWIIALYSF